MPARCVRVVCKKCARERRRKKRFGEKRASTQIELQSHAGCTRAFSPFPRGYILAGVCAVMHERHARRRNFPRSANLCLDARAARKFPPRMLLLSRESSRRARLYPGAVSLSIGLLVFKKRDILWKLVMLGL